MKNCECYTKDGEFLGWFSRSIAVLAIIILKEGNQYYVLASQRGSGTPDKEFIGKWNLCCGYLDFDESTSGAAIRETHEETGVDISKEKIRLIYVNSDPRSDKNQTVSFRYLVTLGKDRSFYEKQFTHKFNEEREVGQIKFINVADLDNYEWAFNHYDIINDAISSLIR